MQLTPDQVVLRGIWAKAVEEGSLELPAMPALQASRTRFLLFREAKRMREEAQQGLVDPVLVESMGMLTPRLRIVDEQHKQVVLESKGSVELAELGKVLGIDSAQPVGQQKVVEESLQRLNSLLEGQGIAPERQSSEVPPATAANPFYTRTERRD